MLCQKIEQYLRGFAHLIVDPFPASLAVEQIRPADDLKMAGYRRLGKLQNVRDLADTQSIFPQQPQNPPTRRIANRMGKFQEVIHRKKS